MSYRRAVQEFIRLYREAGGNVGADPVAAVRELFAAYSQARVFAAEINEMFSAERARTTELERTLQDLQRTHAAVERSEARFRTLVSNASDVVLVIGPDDRISYATPSVERVCGCTEQQLLGTKLSEHVIPQDAAKLSLAFLSARQDPGRAVNVRFRVASPGGEARFIEAALSDMGPDSPVSGIVLNGRDVSERESLEESLRHAAYRDPLTGLPNRGLFTSHVETVWPRDGNNSSRLALLLVDVDRFKLVNDTRGHAAGDDVLVEVARRLREIAPSGSFLSRLGGDEFAILIRFADAETPSRVANDVIEAFSERGGTVPSVSVGVATPGVGGETPSQLFRSADLALYQAKRAGGGSCAVFDPELDEQWIERLEMEADLRDSVQRRQLRLVYQPIVRMAERQVVAVEALVRWDHPERGEVSPGVFIPLAEESDMIVEIGAWVLREALQQVAAWDRVPGGPTLDYISVNVSAAELRDARYAQRVTSALKDTGLRPERLQLELTETLLAEDGHSVIDRLEDLKRLGVRLAIDDFGTGYSSLSYLSRMPVDVMKVDRSFVQGMLESERVESVVRATISLAQALDLKVVAEGVETPEQRDKLLGFGDPLGQGFLFARPVAADQVAALVSDSDRTRAA